ncbi:MAG: TolB family protein, partial [Gaiellaceae bacterium]
THSIHAMTVTVQPDGSVVTGAPYDMIGVPGAEHLNCAFSKDGTKMVYSSDQDGDFEIFLLDLGSGMHTQLTSNTVPDRQPGFTIDGRVVFGSHMTSGAANSNNLDGNRELFIMNDNGTGLWQLTVTTGTAINNWPDIRHEFRPFEYSG